MNWRDISYLKRGNHRQRQAYTALHSLNLFELLAEYQSVLAGTIPLGIDIASSDLDVLCHAEDLAGFAARLHDLFGMHNGFHIEHKAIRGVSSVIGRFEHAGFPIEIFGQPLPVERQYAYRHMLVEYRLLELGGDDMREEIRRLKIGGLKTEPAFAQLLNLKDDPYQALLDLEPMDDSALEKLIPGFHQS